MKTINHNRIKKINYIVALGGGNVIDFSKALVYFTDSKVKEFLCIPTTCGSGSESTNFFVLYNGTQKKSLKSDYILPKTILLDHNNLLGLSQENLISSFLDALSQSIESYWSINSTKESRLYSFEALENLIKSKDKLLDYDLSSLKYAQKGANLAGRAINISKTTAPHAFSYYFNRYNIPHGIAVNITTPYFIDQISDNASNKLRLELDSLSKKIIGAEFKFFGNFYRTILQQFNNISIQEFKKIDYFNFDDFFSSVNNERLKNTPVKISFNSLKNYLNNL